MVLETDQALMLRVRDGDREAFASLYNRFKEPIMAYLTGWTTHKGHAEELAQEIFLRVYRSRERYEPRAKFSTWLWTIAHNAVVDHLRKKREMLAQDLQHAAEDNARERPVAVEEVESPLEDAEVQLIEASEKAQVENCMMKLSAPQREALQLRVLSDLSYDEIAETMGVSVASVKTLLYRARQGVLECMRGCTGRKSEKEGA